MAFRTLLYLMVCINRVPHRRRLGRPVGVIGRTQECVRPEFLPYPAHDDNRPSPPPVVTDGKSIFGVSSDAIATTVVTSQPRASRPANLSGLSRPTPPPPTATFRTCRHSTNWSLHCTCVTAPSPGRPTASSRRALRLRFRSDPRKGVGIQFTAARPKSTRQSRSEYRGPSAATSGIWSSVDSAVVDADHSRA